jgi:4,5-DOPA dioxygenase extradiol
MSSPIHNPNVSPMPVLFIGHGNPMHAIRDNAFASILANLGRELPRPRAVLCISAHWMTRGMTAVTSSRHPETIHDFAGFPRELFDVSYPAPGDPETAERISRTSADPRIQPDHGAWGLDHGAWSVLKHMYPAADVPVLQLSIDITEGPEFHFALGAKLKQLRREGVLIVGSGNVVHNLRHVSFADDAPPFDWAVEFDEWLKHRLQERDYNSVLRHATGSSSGKLSIPTPDHWYPLLYALGASDESDPLRFEYEGIENASISMRCLSLGRES